MRGSRDAGRFFCPRCGSSVFSRSGDEIEVHLGSLDAPDQLRPTYELWTVRRESWLPPFPRETIRARSRQVAPRITGDSACDYCVRMDTIDPDEVTRRVLARYEAADLIRACAWCGRVDVDGEWPLAPRAALAAIDQQHSLTHSICPACSTRLARKPPTP